MIAIPVPAFQETRLGTEKLAPVAKDEGFFSATARANDEAQCGPG